MRNIKIAAATILASALFLTACGGTAGEPVETVEETSTPSTSTSTAKKISNEAPVMPPEVLPFGSSGEDEGLTIQVGEPTPFEPSSEATVGMEGLYPVYFKVTLTNDSEEVKEPYAYLSVASGNEESQGIYDYWNEDLNLESFPTTPLLPGKSISWNEGFAVVDPEDITLQVATSFDGDPLIFSNSL